MPMTRPATEQIQPTKDSRKPSLALWMMAESSSSTSSAQNMLVFQLILYRL